MDGALLNLSQFGECLKIDIRAATADDLQRFRECLAADPDHALQDAEWWTRQDGEFYVFFDQAGNRVWVRAERVLRLSIQHDVDSPKMAVGKIFSKGLAFIRKQAAESRFTEIIFQSISEPLIGFMQRKGFHPVKDNFNVLLSVPDQSTETVN